MPRYSRLLFASKEFILYWLKAVDIHSLQSPFIFQFHEKYISQRSYDKNPEIEKLKNELKSNDKSVQLTDYGAGSSINDHPSVNLSFIVNTCTSKSHFSLLLQKIIKANHFKNVLELGTSLGFNTIYMSKAEVDGLQVHTIEGSEEIAKIAASNFKKCAADNIELHIGNIDHLLQEVLNEMQNVDMVYMDANHTYEATIRYFHIIHQKLHENSIVFVDDIHWSSGMKKAWNELKNHPSVTHSIDIFDAGILFFKKGLQKQHYILEF